MMETKTILTLAAIIVVTAGLRAPLLQIPLERDEGEYAYIAWRLEHGELPYRDWVDQKPPGVFWVYRAAFKLSLPPLSAIHGMGAAFSAATACVLFLLMKRLMGHCWAAVGSLLFVVLSADPRVQGTAANTEMFMLLPLTLSQLAFLHSAPDQKWRWLAMFACGLLTGFASAFKQVAAINWLLQIVLYVLFFELATRGRNALWFALLSTAGALVVWGGIAAYFAANKAFEPLVYNVLTHNLEYINAVPWSERLKLCEKTLGDLFRTEGLAWAFGIIGFIAISRGRRTGLIWFLAQWLIGSLAGISASGYFFPHYFQQWLPVLCVMAALGAEALAKAEFWEKTAVLVRCAVVGCGILAVPAFFILPFFLRQTPDEASRKIYPASYCPEMRQIAARLAEVTKAEDRVYVFGAEAEVLFYAQRVSTTRYIFLFPLYGAYRDAKEKQTAVVEEIATHKPAALLYLPNSLFFVKGTEQFLTQWTQAYMKENFKADLWLAVNQNGKGRLLTGGEGIRPPRVEPGERVLGGLFVRAPKPD